MRRNNIFTIVSGLALMSAMLFSCQKESSNPVVQPSEIGFRSNVTTKTLVDSEDDIVSTGGFRVYGYLTVGDDATPYPVFDPDGDGVEEGVEVNDEDDDGNWDYSPKRYWVLDAEYSFLGIYPSDALVSIPDLSTPLNFTYRHTDAECDFMAAKVGSATRETSGSGVSMKFEHMLSNININLQRETILDFISVKSYTLSGMYKEVSYALSDEGQEWVPTPSGDRSFSVTGDFQEPLFLRYGIPVSLLGEDGINCIPGENLEADVKLVLDCLVTVDGVETSKEITLDFPAGTWEKGKKYTYSSTLNAEGGTSSGGDEPSVSLDIELDETCFSGQAVQVTCYGLETDNVENDVLIQYAVSDTEPQSDAEWTDVDKFTYYSYGSACYLDFIAPKLEPGIERTKLWVRIKCDSQISNVASTNFYSNENRYVIKLNGQNRALTYDYDTGITMTDYVDQNPSGGQIFQIIYIDYMENLDPSLYTECRKGIIQTSDGRYLWHYEGFTTVMFDSVASEICFCAKSDGSYDLRIYNYSSDSSDKYDYMQSGVGDSYPVLGPVSAEKIHSWSLVPVQ